MIEEAGSILTKIQSKVFSDGTSNRQGTRQDDDPQWMRRCFMTGKQCIFCPQDTVLAPSERDSIFVVMPFRDNLETFFDWSLKPFLQSFSGIHEEKIRRADQFTNTGYIMCEKICLRIQQAALVVVELSAGNRNVYYELGLSVGLNKPLLPLCDKSIHESSREEALWRAVGLRKEDVTAYPNVGVLGDIDEEKFAEKCVAVPLGRRQPQLEIVALMVQEDRQPSVEKKSFSERQKHDKGDISLSFERALEAAVGVAISRLEDACAKTGNPGDHRREGGAPELTAAFEAIRKIQYAKDDKRTAMDRLKRCTKMHLTDPSGQLKEYTAVREKVDSAFVCIIDLAFENPLSYFWLGYCHARNINVIPIYRDPVRDKSPPHSTLERAGESADDARKSAPLAFDIRALWTMNHTEKETKALANKLAAVLEPVLIRDVMTQQRRTFWSRLTRAGRVHIYNGAVHHEKLVREMVGDWDLRAASELVKYLSSTEESVVPVLANPIYTPETIRDKLQSVSSSPDELSWSTQDDDYIERYIDAIKNELSGQNCLIVGSADVNPLTEILLAFAYQETGKTRVRRPPCFINAGVNGGHDRSAVFATKGTTGTEETSDERTFPRRFSRPGGSASERGFGIDGHIFTMPYSSQDENLSEPFSILAHLVITRNPFSTDQDNLIVILNGVSGPATFGLAEVLTGGDAPERALESEDLLRRINEVWDKEMPQKYNGVEAIIEVIVSPPPISKLGAPPVAEEDDDSRTRSVAGKLYDRRFVKSCRLFAPVKGTEESRIRYGNPRPFPI